MAAAGAGVLAVIVVIVVVLTATRPGDDAPRPAGPGTRTQTPTDTTTAPPLMGNGRIQSIKEYLGDVRPGCAGCFADDGGDGEFDPDTGTVLFTSYQPATTPESPTETYLLAEISVVGPDGTHADLTCGKKFACPGDGTQGVVSGPGEDELTFWTPDFGSAKDRPLADQQVRVVGFDGTARFTMDLKPAIPRDEHALFLTWSPDGSRAAVTTREYTEGSTIHRTWLVHRDRSEPQLVHTASDTGPKGEGPATFLSPAAWHPDGSRLGLTEERSSGHPGSPKAWTRVVSVLLPEPGDQGPGTATTLHEFDDWCACSRRTFLWSPDGTRVALLEPSSNLDARGRVLQLSAVDGKVLDQQPLPGWPLVWPAKRP